MHDEPIYPSTRQVIAAVVTTSLALGVMATLRWMGVPAGEFVDWLVAVAGFWWLLGITTVPWNLYFGARAVQAEIVLSQKRGLVVERDDAVFVGRTARRSLAFAVALHLTSAAGFAALAMMGLTSIGWFGAVAAGALTVFRPTVRLYRHVASALRDIGRRARYPRDDVRTALERLEDHQLRLTRIEHDLRVDLDDAWARSVERRIDEVRRDLTTSGRRLDTVVDANEEAHRHLARDAERAAQKLGEDSAFLGNVREIIRFVKHA